MDPDHILEIGFAFRKSKALLSAVELGVFAALAHGPQQADALASKLGVHGRSARDFFDALVALKLLERDPVGRYANTADGALYLDPRRKTYIGGLLEYLNERMYPSWGALTQALRQGLSQSGPSAAGGFASFYDDAAAFEIFLKGMTGGSLMPARALAEKFPWHDYATFMDVGTAQGCLPVVLAGAHPHLTGGGFDLPALAGAFTRYVGEHGLAARLKFHAGDFFKDPLPCADVLILGRVLHDWDLPARKKLLRKAYDTLPDGGALIVQETFIDETRRDRPHNLLSSLNMLIQTEGGSEFTISECMHWVAECGFAATRALALTGAYSAVVGLKGPESKRKTCEVDRHNKNTG
jgi:O-methyltransferase domain/Dimerisation domain